MLCRRHDNLLHAVHCAEKLFSGLHTLITGAHYYQHSPHKVEQCHLERTLALPDQDSQQLRDHGFYMERSE